MNRDKKVSIVVQLCNQKEDIIRKHTMLPNLKALELTFSKLSHENFGSMKKKLGPGSQDLGILRKV